MDNPSYKCIFRYPHTDTIDNPYIYADRDKYLKCSATSLIIVFAYWDCCTTNQKITMSN